MLDPDQESFDEDGHRKTRDLDQESLDVDQCSSRHLDCALACLDWVGWCCDTPKIECVGWEDMASEADPLTKQSVMDVLVTGVIVELSLV